jgi:acetate kinase
MRVLVLNSGSSSLKFQLFDGSALEPLLRGGIDRIGEGEGSIRVQRRQGGETHEFPASKRRVVSHAEAVQIVAQLLQQYAESAQPEVIGHRVVHGGERYYQPTLITPQVLEEIRQLNPLAPLHNPANVTGIEACLERFPALPQVAVFDTGFHHTLPEKAFRYAIPEEIYTRYHVRRYGFHGTSHAYVTREAAQFLGRLPQQVNLIVLHLGNGASACAVRNGQSVDTSLGFTPLEGLVMGTRCGDLDPAIPFFLAREAGMSFEEIEKLLSKRSGLLGLAGANDMRDIEARAVKGDASALRALEIFCYRIKKYVGAYIAVLGRLDALVFTAGIGEHSSKVRELICSELSHLGIELDTKMNTAPATGARTISEESSRIPVLVVPTNEELEIARSCVELLTGK